MDNRYTGEQIPNSTWRRMRASLNTALKRQSVSLTKACLQEFDRIRPGGRTTSQAARRRTSPRRTQRPATGL